MSEADIYDLTVIGGGINGAGIAADAAGRGLKVLLLEAGDLASGTSSASSKLIHGGLRYLEHHEFRLVHEALQEREVLLAKAPHLVRPLRFVLPHVPGMRSKLVLQAGLFIYDHLAQRQKVPGSHVLDLATDPAGRPLKSELTSGFEYWDCWVDDARLVIANARAAAENGADIQTRTRMLGATIQSGRWHVKVQDSSRRVSTQVTRALVNAAGPWVGQVADVILDADGARPLTPVRLVKGSHIVFDRIAGAEAAYLLQSPDRRVVFALPFEQRFTLIGTTDIAFAGDPGTVRISEQETDYLVGLANRFFRTPLRRSDIRWSFSGVRSLYEDGGSDAASVTRDYHLELAAGEQAPPLLTVLGGKVTTHRRLAEAVMGRLAPYFPTMGRDWTREAPLPGGELDAADFDSFLHSLPGRWPRLDPTLLDQLAARHGSRIAAVIGDAETMADMGTQLGGRLTQREVEYFKRHEWARTPEDVLWRRSKAGLHMSARELANAHQALAALLS